MGATFSAPVQTGPGAHPASCTMGTGSFPGSKERPGRDADPSPLLVPRSKKSRAIPLLPLRAVRPVQVLSACTRVHFTFFPFMPIRGLVPLGFFHHNTVYNSILHPSCPKSPYLIAHTILPYQRQTAVCDLNPIGLNGRKKEEQDITAKLS